MIRQLLVLLFASFFSLAAFAQEIPFSQEEYDLRREQFITDALSNMNDNANVIRAFKGLPIEQSYIDYIKNRIETSGEFDFNLVQLIRILYFSNGQYDDIFLPDIKSVPLWLTPNEKLRVYWSENHTTMWLSSAYLLKQKYGYDVDPELEKKLNHCLDLKIKYGYYEFFSSVYFPYTLSGLLNLVDFAEDPIIKQKAILATERLLKEVLILVNDKGTFFPAAGRNYSGKYASAYDQNHNNPIYLLTGLGEKQTSSSHSGAFLATSTLDVKSIVESWKSKEDQFMKIGFPIKESAEVLKDLLKEDKVIFQWSGGGYFDPEFAFQTFNLIDRYNLWDHKEFKSFKVFKDIPAALAPKAAKAASAISTSSVISDQTLALFKNNSVTLSSIQNYFKGCNGYQQWPWSANVGTSAVLTYSGEAKSVFKDDINANSTLPYIEQKSNVALIMYRAKKELALFGFDNHAVTLLWEPEKFDEIAFNGKWIIGREDNSYVAVLRHCTDTLNGMYTCGDQDGQLWGVIVGNSEMYGSFDNFKNIISQAKYQEKWIYNKNRKEWIYYGMIDVDGKFIEHNWVENFLSEPADSTTEQPVTTGIKYLESANEGFSLYPNPATGRFTIAFETPVSGNYTVRIHDITGRQMYFRTMDSNITPAIQVGTEGWPIGLYTVIVETNEGIMSRKIMVQQ